MAEGSCKPPPEIVMNDDDPKKGYCTLFLTIPGLKVKKAMFGKAEPSNGTITAKIEKEAVCLEATVTKDGKTSSYMYKKNMPDNINPAKSSYKVKEETIVLSLNKAVSESWVIHQKYMIKRD